MRRGGFLAALLLCGVASAARGELKPDEIVILATPSHTSRELRSITRSIAGCRRTTSWWST